MRDRGTKRDVPDRGTSRCIQILDAAAVCFRQKGFHGASMAEIARAAGMSVGHIYHYFANKEAIITAIVEGDVDHVQEVVDIHSNADDVVESMVQDLDLEFGNFGDADRDHIALRVEILAESARNPKIAEKTRMADRVMEGELRKLIRLGGGDGNIGARTEVIIALFDGMMMRKLRNPDLDLAETLPLLKAVMRQLLTDAIEPEPALPKAEE